LKSVLIGLGGKLEDAKPFNVQKEIEDEKIFMGKKNKSGVVKFKTRIHGFLQMVINQNQNQKSLN